MRRNRGTVTAVANGSLVLEREFDRARVAVIFPWGCLADMGFASAREVVIVRSTGNDGCVVCVFVSVAGVFVGFTLGSYRTD